MPRDLDSAAPPLPAPAVAAYLAAIERRVAAIVALRAALEARERRA